jgi:hypothetical protein
MLGRSLTARERPFGADRRADRDRLGSHNKTRSANCRAGFKTLVRPKGLEPLLLAPSVLRVVSRHDLCEEMAQYCGFPDTWCREVSRRVTMFLAASAARLLCIFPKSGASIVSAALARMFGKRCP